MSCMLSDAVSMTTGSEGKRSENVFNALHPSMSGMLMSSITRSRSRMVAGEFERCHAVVCFQHFRLFIQLRKDQLHSVTEHPVVIDDKNLQSVASRGLLILPSNIYQSVKPCDLALNNCITSRIYAPAAGSQTKQQPSRAGREIKVTSKSMSGYYKK